MMKEGFVYLWYDRSKKMYYIGSHWGTLDDGYICSSVWMKRAYKKRPQDFKRRIIQRNILEGFTVIEEDKWLSLIEKEELGKKYYNLQKYTTGLQKAWRNNKKRKQSVEEKEKRANSNRGQKRSNETREKIRQAQLTPEAVERNKNKILGEKNYFYGKKLIGNQNGFFGKTHKPETRRLLSEQRKGNTIPNHFNASGSKWWNNGVINKRSYACPGDKWVRGRI